MEREGYIQWQWLDNADPWNERSKINEEDWKNYSKEANNQMQDGFIQALRTHQQSFSNYLKNNIPDAKRPQFEGKTKIKLLIQDKVTKIDVEQTYIIDFQISIQILECDANYVRRIQSIPDIFEIIKMVEREVEEANSAQSQTQSIIQESHDLKQEAAYQKRIPQNIIPQSVHKQAQKSDIALIQEIKRHILDTYKLNDEQMLKIEEALSKEDCCQNLLINEEFLEEKEFDEDIKQNIEKMIAPISKQFSLDLATNEVVGKVTMVLYELLMSFKTKPNFQFQINSAIMQSEDWASSAALLLRNLISSKSVKYGQISDMTLWVGAFESDDMIQRYKSIIASIDDSYFDKDESLQEKVKKSIVDWNRFAVGYPHSNKAIGQDINTLYEMKVYDNCLDLACLWDWGDDNQAYLLDLDMKFEVRGMYARGNISVVQLVQIYY